jgi:hypothetical protein
MFAFSRNWFARNAPSLEPFGMLALFGLLTAGPAILTLRVLDPALVLPAYSILLLAEAVVTGIVAHVMHVPEKAADIILWDLAGAFTLIGCAAAVFGEPDQAALFLEEQAELRSDPRP